MVETGVGNIASAVETARAIQALSPSVAIFSGIAGGRKDVKKGDVVVGDKVYYYETGKVGTSFSGRPTVHSPSPAILQHARTVASSTFSSFPNDSSPRVFFGAIASGEKVVASKTLSPATLLDLHYSDSLALEMEGSGFLRNAKSCSCEFLVVRGISDLLVGKSQADAAGLQHVAAKNAAQLSFKILSTFDPYLQDGEPCVEWSLITDSSPVALTFSLVACGMLRQYLDDMQIRVVKVGDSKISFNSSRRAYLELLHRNNQGLLKSEVFPELQKLEVAFDCDLPPSPIRSSAGGLSEALERMSAMHAGNLEVAHAILSLPAVIKVVHPAIMTSLRRQFPYVDSRHELLAVGKASGIASRLLMSMASEQSITSASRLSMLLNQLGRTALAQAAFELKLPASNSFTDPWADIVNTSSLEQRIISAFMSTVYIEDTSPHSAIERVAKLCDVSLALVREVIDKWSLRWMGSEE